MKKILLLIVFIFTFFCYGDTVSGIITKSDGKPVAGAKISIFNTRTKTLVNSAFSDKNGRFIFENLQPDYYRIVVSKTGYCEGNSGRIEINNEKFGVQKVQIILMKPGSISGFVYGIDSNPISGAEVILGTKKARTNEKGFYKIEGLNPEFHHVVSVYAPGFVKEWKGSVEVKEGKETAGIDFILSFAGRVEGIVVDSESGKPVRGVQVSCSGPVFVSGLTDVNGGFFLDNLKEGFYTLHFYRQGY